MYIQQRYQPHSYNNSLIMVGAQNNSSDQTTIKNQQFVQVQAPSVFGSANLMSSKISEQLKNSQKLPLKFIPQPSLLSKQAIELKDSLDRLKQFSSRKTIKINEEQQQIQEDQVRRETFGKERARLTQNDKIFQITPKIPQDYPSLQPPFDSDSTSPIKFQVTQQSDSEIQKIYQYQESNQSDISNDDKVINIYTQNAYDSDYIVSKEYIKSSKSLKYEDKREPDRFEDEQNMMTQDIIKEEEHQSEQSIEDSKRQLKSYSKMTPEEANQAYQGRKKEIKSHLDLAKQQSTKYKSTKPQINSLFQKKKTFDKTQTIQSSPREEVMSIIRTNRNKESRNFTPAKTPTPYENIEEPQQLPKDFNLLSNKKSALLNDIMMIDREIKLNQDYNQKEQQQSSNFNSQTIFNQTNKSFDHQMNTQVNMSISQHRTNHLYIQGQITNEKKNLVSSWTKAQQKKKELEQCTFKPLMVAQPPSQRQSNKNDSNSTQREKTSSSTNKFKSIKLLKQLPNLFLDSSESPNITKKSIVSKSFNKRGGSQSQNSNNKNKVLRSSSGKQSTSFLQEPLRKEQESYMNLQNLQVIKLINISQAKWLSFSNEPPNLIRGSINFADLGFRQIFESLYNQDKVNAVTQKYQQILDQANKLKASMRPT